MAFYWPIYIIHQPMCMFAQAGKLELVSEGRDNPLHAAVRAGRSELIEVLLAAGARIDIRDDRWVLLAGHALMQGPMAGEMSAFRCMVKTIGVCGNSSLPVHT